MTRRHPRAAWAAALLTAVVTAGALTGPPAQALAGDAATGGAYAFTAKIDIGGVRACSGTLINNQWLITAASCFTDDPAQKDGRLEPVAVASTSWQGGCVGSEETRTGAVAGRVDDIRTWIRESTASTLNVWKLQMVTKTSSGLYHAMRDSNGDWTGFGDVQKVAGTIEDVKFAADAAISGKNYVFALGGNGHLYQADRRATGGWEAFRDLTDEIGAKPGLTRVAVTSTGKGLALIGLADGRIYHTVQDPSEKWSKWGDVTAKLGTLGNATQVTTAQTSGGETHVGVVADKKAYHAIRQADGTWSESWGRVSNLPTGLDSINGMAFAGTGSDLQIGLSSPTGDIKHAIRAGTGSWSTFGNLSTKLGPHQPSISIDAAAVNGEFQTVIVTTDGKIRHALRHTDGTWDAADEPTGCPGTPIMAAITGSTS
ncbi:trypsin-like serine protease [Streptomyces sp. NPDC102264]|uniref:trypsin-like serine protease n=1 Tax=Streptomyces sp. NPDC102264 TaxID=3366149 RepID=UPI0037F4B9BA